MSIRPPAVAGLFYSAEAESLRQTVAQLLQAVEAPEETVKALIVPHAGYIYSGQTAAYAYQRLQQQSQPAQRIVLLGPTHRVAVNGIALPSQQAFATPLGDIPLDSSALQQLTELPFCEINDAAHAQEHSLEVQLPFLQTCLESFQLIPLLVGQASCEQIKQVLTHLQDAHTLIIISTDLSHFHPYQQAKEIDQHTIERVLQYDHTLMGQQACGCKPLNGFLSYAQQQQWQCQLLDYRNSGDTAGDKNRVVGYASFAVH